MTCQGIDEQLIDPKEDQIINERLEQDCFLLPLQLKTRVFHPMGKSAGVFTNIYKDEDAQYKLTMAVVHMWAQYRYQLCALAT